MPLYNFEPGDEDGDWESELLEEDKEQQMALHIGVCTVFPLSHSHTSQLIISTCVSLTLYTQVLSKHDTLTQCWANVALAQPWVNMLCLLGSRCY